MENTIDERNPGKKGYFSQTKSQQTIATYFRLLNQLNM